MNRDDFTKYEVARILGARALQIAIDAPLLVKIPKEDLERIKYDPLKMAEIEFDSGILPISVKRPFPKKRDERIKKLEPKKEEKSKEHKEEEDKEIEKKERYEEKEIREEGEIMELAQPEDELEVSGEEEAGVEE